MLIIFLLGYSFSERNKLHAPSSRHEAISEQNCNPIIYRPIAVKLPYDTMKRLATGDDHTLFIDGSRYESRHPKPAPADNIFAEYIFAK